MNKVRRVLLMHREIAKRMGLNLSETIDHVNGDSLDNRRRNLRSATRLQQQHNTNRKGVCWDSKRKKWRAYITDLGRHVNLGRFDTEKEAVRVREVAARKLHKEFYRE